MRAWLPGLAATLLTWFVRQALDGWWGGSHFLLPYTLPIIVGAVTGGWRGGLLTTLLNCLLGLAQVPWTPADLSRLGILALNGVFMSGLCQRLRDRQQALESRYHAVFHSQMHFIGLLAVDGTILEVNDTAVRVTGETKADLLGLRMWEAPWWRHEPALRERHRLAVAQAAAGVQVRFTSTYCTFTGEVRWVDYTLTPFRDRQGRILFLIPEGHDVTELRLQEENFRQAFECAAIGKALVSLEGRWVRVNRALCDLTGYTAEELLAIDFQTITHPEDLAEDLALVNSVLAGERSTYHLEKRYFHKSGQVVHILLTVALVRDAEGNPLYFIAQIQDISEAKAARERNEQMRQQLEYEAQVRLRLIEELEGYNLRLQELLEQRNLLWGMAAHDLRRPLSGILEHARVGEAEAAAVVAEGLLAVVDQLLDVTTQTTGSLPQRRESLNLRTLVDEVMHQYAVHVDLPDYPLFVAGDSTRLHQMLTNLVGNAVQYSPVGTRVDVRLQGQGNYAEVRVTDQGPGIPEGRQAVLTAAGSSSGLGLPIARRIAEEHGGSLEFVSQEGIGSSFWVLLPLS